MRYFSMFTGVGGFELGIEQAFSYVDTTYRTKNGGSKKVEAVGDSEGYEVLKSFNAERRWNGKHDNSNSKNRQEHPTCVGFSEIDKYASQLLSIKFPGTKNYGDATKINEHELPDFDLLCGGFPCQSFSIAGKRKGFADTRGTLFFDIARILAYKKPRYLLLENVKGLLSHDRGETFQTILRVLTDLGYFVEWQVLNSKNFGVPQNRERVFIIGYLGGEPGSKVFPIRGTDEKDTRIIGQDVAYTIDANYYKGTNTLEKGRRSIVQVNKPTHSNDRVYGENGVAPTLNTMQGGRRQPKVKINSSQDGKLSPTDGVSQTLSAGHYNQPKIAHTVRTSGRSSGIDKKQNWDSYEFDGRIRRLTPLECERLQGFPDNWTADFSDTQRYKMMGNAVTVNVVREVIKRLFFE